MDRKKYPANWEQIARGVKDAAGWKCEKCGMGHMEDKTMASCLTVHHPDRDPENTKPRTQALCARCHLAAEAQARRSERNKDQFTLFDLPEFSGTELINCKKKEYPYRYAWKNNLKRAGLFGQRLRVLKRLAMNSAAVEFEGGQIEIISRNAIRKGFKHA